MPTWVQEVVLDPQTSGGLALFSTTPIDGAAKIGRVVKGAPAIRIG